MQTRPTIESLITPASVAELAELITTATGPIDVVGGMTKASYRNITSEHATPISTHRINKVLHYEPADLTIAVEAGMTLAEVNRVLGENNQMLPLDSWAPDQATLGGLFASGIAGPRRFRFGSLRDWVLGLEVMAPDGTITKSGGMVVKNVTGYDLPRLHYGAQGVFGAVTRLNLKVYPREQAARSIQATFDDLAEAYAAAVAALRSQLEPSAILISFDGSWNVAIACEGAESTIDLQSESLLDAMTEAGSPVESTVVEGGGPALESWNSVMAADSAGGLARLPVPASKQQDMLARLSGLSGSTLVADPGSSLMYISGPPSIEWREALRSLGYPATFLSLPDELKQDIDVFGDMDSHTRRLMRRLKDEFDPEGRLNPGRFQLESA